ncbi:MAG: DUF465 domain-containing protein [Pseudomonadota bacterium]
MALQSHLAELEKRHQAIDNQIQSAEMQPGTDHLEVVELKRRKLRLKEEIVRLQSGSGVLH